MPIILADTDVTNNALRAALVEASFSGEDWYAPEAAMARDLIAAAGWTYNFSSWPKALADFDSLLAQPPEAAPAQPPEAAPPEAEPPEAAPAQPPKVAPAQRHVAQLNVNSCWDIASVDADGMGQRLFSVGYDRAAGPAAAESVVRLIVLAMNRPGGIEGATKMLRLFEPWTAGLHAVGCNDAPGDVDTQPSPDHSPNTTQIKVSISYDYGDLPRWRMRFAAWVSVTLAHLLGAKITARKNGDD
jgi:hypothetical protein